MSKRYRAFAPASAANLSVGFDLLGAALKPVDNHVLGDEIIIEEQQNVDSESPCQIESVGRYAHKLSHDPKKNIIYDAYLLYKEALSKKGRNIKPLKMTLKKDLPICSGLGSSAASVVAGVMALNALHEEALDSDEALALMGQLEGRISGSIHYDNVAPCYYGGLQLITGETGRISMALPCFDNWLFVSCFPGIKVSTSQARKILPVKYLRRDLITYGRRLSTFVHALHIGDEKLAASMLVDVVAEPYRARLIPGFFDARAEGEKLGAYNTGISGSGSSIFSVFTDMDKALMMKEYLERYFIDNEDGFCHICTIDKRGAFTEALD